MLPFVFLNWNRTNRLPFLCTHDSYHHFLRGTIVTLFALLWSIMLNPAFFYLLHRIKLMSIPSTTKFLFNDDLLQSIQE
ncbi:hypothetical protein BDA96_03G385500 [Sorghum bicolor]|uniref:Uncharacterized protein n=1 Tax=Sorghum bicolor TaxID=4558 RepID=A0A921RI93_SORBI|nr:hypothetical protein BDA96_03G385500 [Sorghum bicolor]